MENLYGKLHNLYPVQKTLRFELKPIGKTKENIEKDGILKEDEYRSEVYKRVKKYCDEYHRKFIDESLKDIKVEGLLEYYELYKTEEKDQKQIEKFKQIQESLRKQIADKFKSNNKYKGLFSKELIQDYLKAMYEDKEEALSEIKEFDKFTTYFVGYNQNRENMYTHEEKSTAISYRLINENLPTFLFNMKIYQNIVKKIPEIIDKTYKQLEEYIQTEKLDDMFELDYYNEVLTQRGIEVYNIIISGKSKEDGNKIKGLNEYINEYNQTHNDRIPKLKELYKQILSDKIGASFVIETIENDSELVNSINEYYLKLKQVIIDNDINLINLLKELHNYDTERIYVNNDSTITNIAQSIFEDWNYIQNAINRNYDENYKGKIKNNTEKYIEQRKKDLKRIKSISLAHLEKCIMNIELINKDKIINYFEQYLIKEDLINKIGNSYAECENILNDNYAENSKQLIKDEKAIEQIKNLLDTIKEVQEFIKTLIPKDRTLNLDEEFYSMLDEKYKVLSEIIPLYNKARNYLTQKPYSTKKIKLNFSSPTFLGGWDITKETSNLGVLLLKDNKYYLGILNNKKIFNEEYETTNNTNIYKKMKYKLLPSPNKMLPKVFFSKSRIDEFNPSNELLENYNKGAYKKGDNFNLNFCHELIDFYKASIQKNKDWASFDFDLQDTNKYDDISQFYKDVEQQGYKIDFVNFSEDYINEKIENGELYLFKIYNKDFSEYSKGKENLHTMYWKALFDEENLKNVIYKLNGEAEVFYRKASLKISDTAVHLANKLIKNKNIETVKKKPTSEFKYDLIKNKRYTVDKFQLHVPITMNFKSNKISNINEIVNQYLKYYDDIYVIGIDRGERNLVYISVINSKGNIVYQKSLNEIVNNYNNIEYKTNYHTLLDNKEKERDQARKSWKTIDNIKELKEGYMGQVIHEIVKLMQKYNAIIVIEDLNKGFKNARIKVEKQIYQKFEKMLIDKLNYLVIKDKKSLEEGGILNAYQLTNQFETFKKIGKQSGVLFYIPAWCTSKIDPTTGFINLFYIKNENTEKSKEFVSKFDEIRYNQHQDYFEFDIDYTKFTDRLNESKRNWTICTNSTRIRTFRNPNQNNEWTNEEIELTKEWKNLFEKYEIDLGNIKTSILEKADSKFFNATKEKEGFYGFTNLFKLTVQMRNSKIGEMEDYLISPVKNKYGKFYDTREMDETLPKDADGNGAYNIARKGLMLVRQIQNTKDSDLNKIKYDITNKEWLQYAQDEDNL